MAVRAATPCPGAAPRPPTPPMEWQVVHRRTRSPSAEDPTPPTRCGATSTSSATPPAASPGPASSAAAARRPDRHRRLRARLDPTRSGPATSRRWWRTRSCGRCSWRGCGCSGPTGGALPALAWLDANAARVEQAVTATRGVPRRGHRRARPGPHPRARATCSATSCWTSRSTAAGRWVPWTPRRRPARLDRRRPALRGRPGGRHRLVRRRAARPGLADRRAGAGPPLPLRRRRRRQRRPRRDHRRPRRRRRDGDQRAADSAAAPTPSRCRTPSPASPRSSARHDRAVTVGLPRAGRGDARGRRRPRRECCRCSTRSPRTQPRPAWSRWSCGPQRDREHPNAPRPDRDHARRRVPLPRRATAGHHRAARHPADLPVDRGLGGRHREARLRRRGVRRWVEQVLRQYLAPLPPYGPEGRGWPLGRRVFAPELEAAALQVDGVEFLVPGPVDGSPCLLGLRLAELTEDGEWVEPGVARRRAGAVGGAGAGRRHRRGGRGPRPRRRGAGPRAPARPAVPVREPPEVC